MIPIPRESGCLQGIKKDIFIHLISSPIYRTCIFFLCSSILLLISLVVKFSVNVMFRLTSFFHIYYFSLSQNSSPNSDIELTVFFLIDLDYMYTFSSRSLVSKLQLFDRHLFMIIF